MKALLVSDDSLAVENISRVLEIAGYDVIVYKWLLKALDNIEEIAPHLIIISTKDYPRHWKTLTQFAKTNMQFYKPQIILYAEGGLSEEDEKKAEYLGVRGIFYSVNVEGLDELRKIIKKEKDIFSGKLFEENTNIQNGNYSISEENKTVENEIPDSENDGIVSVSDIISSASENKENEQELSSNEQEISANEQELFSNEQEISANEQELSANEQNSINESKEIIIEEIPTKKSEKITSVIFEDPKEGFLITGFLSNINENSFDFLPDFDFYSKNLSEGTILENASLKSTKGIYSKNLKVLKVREKIQLEIS